MGDFLEIFYVKDLKMVDVRKYDGVENGRYAWTFLGYDIVATDKEGRAVSILADEETKYDFLQKLETTKGVKGIDYYDHEGINVGDIRVKPVDNTRLEIFGRLPVVSKSAIKSWIDRRPGFSFLHYKPVKGTGNVKSLGSK